jgi:hypothetical protein
MMVYWIRKEVAFVLNNTQKYLRMDLYAQKILHLQLLNLNLTVARA